MIGVSANDADEVSASIFTFIAVKPRAGPDVNRMNSLFKTATGCMIINRLNIKNFAIRLAKLKNLPVQFRKFRKL